MARCSCAVRVEPLEGMKFLTESGSTRAVQRDARYISDIAQVTTIAIRCRPSLYNVSIVTTLDGLG